MEQEKLKTLQESFELLKDLVGKETPLTVESYPVVEGMTDYQKQLFFIKHSLHYAGMTVGKLNGILHEADHGEKLEVEKLKQKVVSLMFTCYKLSFTLGITPEEFVKDMDELLMGELGKSFLSIE